MTDLHEHKNVRQRPEEGFRRWFVNEYFDLIFWYTREGGDLKGFQICYSKNHHEKAFTWEQQSASTHFVSDSGVGNRSFPFATGVLHGDAGVIPHKVVAKLQKYQGELPAELMELLISQIDVYNHKSSSK